MTLDLDKLMVWGAVTMLLVVAVWVGTGAARINAKTRACYAQGLYPHQLYGWDRDVVCMPMPRFQR